MAAVESAGDKLTYRPMAAAESAGAKLTYSGERKVRFLDDVRHFSQGRNFAPCRTTNRSSKR